jgi:uncharacterized iron-regulated membrane protein
MDSDAYVTFVGTGSDSNLLKILILCLLLALLIVSIWLCWVAKKGLKPEKMGSYTK